MTRLAGRRTQTRLRVGRVGLTASLGREPQRVGRPARAGSAEDLLAHDWPARKAAEDGEPDGGDRACEQDGCQRPGIDPGKHDRCLAQAVSPSGEHAHSAGREFELAVVR